MLKKSTARNCVVTSSLLLGASSIGLLVDTASASGPQNPHVVAGQANFSFGPNTFLIKASDGAIIRYTAFDLTAGQLAQFIQPHSDARVLNFISSAVPSSIDGNLVANGIVYFANPAGIIFGNNAVVNVGGIYAAAARISYADFVSGNDHFFSIMGDVSIQPGAQINAANAAHFIGRQVINQGTVSVPDGVITMAANDGTVTITEAGGHYYLHLQGGTDIGPGNYGVDNTGVIDAGGTGQIVLGAGDMYSSAIRLSGNGISGGSVRFDSNVDLASDVAVTGTDVTFEGTIDGGFALTVDGDAIFNGDIGQLTELASVLVQGNTEINAAGINTTGAQTFQGSVVLLANAILTGSVITFEQTVDGGFDLTINGDAVFNGNIGDVAPLMSLLVQGVTQIGGDISTVGGQTYQDAVTLLSDAVLAGSVVSFDSTVDGAFALEINGDVLFSGDVNTDELLVQGAATIDTANITTTGTQDYLGAVTLLQDALLTGSVVSFGSTVDGGFFLEIDGDAVFEGDVNIGQLLVHGLSSIGANVTTLGTQQYAGAVTLLQDALLSGTLVSFGSTIDGGFFLEIDGDVVFEGDVNIGQLLVHGLTSIDTASIATTGTQEYVGAVTLLQDALLAGSTVTFRSTVDGAFALEVDGNAVFEGDVNLAQLLVQGIATIDTPNITTTGSQQFVGAVTLAQNALLTGSTVTFGSTVDGAFFLEIDGDAVFQGNVNVDQLLVHGAASIDAAEITTAGTQEYVGAVTLLQNAVLNGSTFSFRSTVDGGFFLEVNGDVVFEGDVTLAQLLVQGLTTIDTASIATTSTQEYVGAVTLLQNAVLTGSTVTFRSTADGAVELEIDGNAVFEGDVNLAQLLVQGMTTLNTANVTTTGSQTYEGAVTLLQDALLTGTLMTFGSTIDGGFFLEIDGDVVFEGNVNIGQLLVHGLTSIDTASITTAGAQDYLGAVTLLSDALLEGSLVTFGSTVDGVFFLEINGDVVFEGDVNIGQLLVHGTTTIDTGNISTAGTQEYVGAVMILQNALLTGSTVTFQSTVDGAVELEIDGNAVFAGDVNLAQLLVQGMTVIDTANISTSGSQEYVGAVTLAQNALLAGSTVTFRNTIDGNFALEIDGDAVFQGQVNIFSLDVTQDTLVNTDLIQTTGHQSYKGLLTFQGLSDYMLLAGGAINAGDDVNSDNNLTMDGQTVTLDMDVTVTGGGNLDVHGLFVGGGNVTADQNITVHDDNAFVAGDVHAIAGTAQFQNNSLVAGDVTAGTDVLFGTDGTVGGNVVAGNDVDFGNGATVGDTVNNLEGNVTAGNNAAFDGNATIVGNVAANGADATFGSGSSVGGDVFALMNVTFGDNGSVGGNVDAQLGNAGFGDDGTVGGNVTAGDNVAFGNTGSVGGDVLAQAGDAQFGNDGTVGGNVTAGDNVAFGNNANVGGNVDAQLGDVLFGDAGDVGGNVAAGDDVAFGDDGSVDGTVTAGNNVTFGQSGTVAGDVTAGAGSAVFGDNASFGGNVIAGQDVTLKGSSAFVGAGDQQVSAIAGTVHAHGAINSSKTGNLTLDGGTQVLLDQDVQVANGGLVVNAPVVRFGADVTTDGSQTINANDILTNGSHTAADSDVAFNGNVQLQNALNVSAGSGNIFFGGTVNGPFALAANSSGVTTLSGAVDLASLLSTGGGMTRIAGGQVSTTQGQTYGNAVVIDQMNAILTAGGSLVFMEAVNSAAGQGRGLDVTAGNGSVTFGKSVGAGADGRLGHLSVDANGGLIFFGTDGGAPVEVLTLGDIRLNTNAPGSNDGFATIGGWNDLAFQSANGDFVMGQLQKMSVLGTLRIDAANGVAYLGDLSALGDIHVAGSQIWIILRDAVENIDQGVDFITGGQFFFSVNPGVGVFSPGGQWIANGGADLPRPQFAAPDANLDGNATLQGFLKRVFSRELTRDGDMIEFGRFLDLSAEGVATTDLSTALAAELVDDSETAEVSDEAQLSATDRERLEQMVNLVVRDLSPGELQDFAMGRGMYMDQEARDQAVGFTPPQRYSVSIGRLDSRPETIDGVIEAFERIVRGRDEILYSDSEISDALDVAWDSYQMSNPGADGRGLVPFLTTRVAEDSEAIDELIALDVIRHLRSFERAYQAVGPNSREAFRLAIENQLRKFQGRFITAQHLREALYAAE